MHAEHALPNQSTERQALEAFAEVVVQQIAVPLGTFLVESIQLVHRVCLVVASKHEDVIGVFHFQCKEQQQNLNAVRPSINVISIVLFAGPQGKEYPKNRYFDSGGRPPSWKIRSKS